MRYKLCACVDPLEKTDGVAMYELRKVDEAGLPDGAKGGVVASQEVWEEGGIKKPHRSEGNPYSNNTITPVGVTM